jgi:hypothetical protein
MTHRGPGEGRRDRPLSLRPERRRKRLGNFFPLSVHALLAILFVAGTLLAACGEHSAPTAVSTETSIMPRGGASFTAMPDDEDLCDIDDAFSSCHSWTGIHYVDDYHTCPDGCYTFSFSGVSTWQSKMLRAINLIPADGGACGVLRSYATSAWYALRIRYYHNADGASADTHPSKDWNTDGQPDSKAMMHIWVGRLQQSDTQLANTIAHEAWHASYNSDDQVAAQAAADMCVPGGYP